MTKNLAMNSELTENTDISESPPRRHARRPPRCPPPALPRPKHRESASPFRGWILYDGDCPSCTASAKRFDRIFCRRGFVFLPLQTNWVLKRLDLEPGAPLEEMHVLTAGGRDIGGADAVIFLARQIWWAQPFAALARLPGMHKLLDRGYRWIAAHRGCDHITCDVKKRRLPSRRFTKTAVERPPLLEFWPGWIALIVFPLLALLTRNHVAPWQFMWLTTGAIFLGCKWLSFWNARTHVRVGRAFAYFILWPGMDAEKFLRTPAGRMLAFPHKRAKTAVAIAKIFLGAVLLFGLARLAPHLLLTGWLGMIGMILVLHFGIFALLP